MGAAGHGTIARLVDHLTDDASGGPFAGELAEWLATSTRFRAFAQTHQDKIRRKVRGTTDEDSLLDVRAELRVAHLLLADRRIGLAFEAYGSGRIGPDFTVTVGGEPSFNLEVTRLHGERGATFGWPLLGKLRQLPPSVPNAVLVAIEGDDARVLDVASAFLAVRARADRKDETFFVRRGFAGTRAFNERFLRLGGVFVLCDGAVGDSRVSWWTNRSARIALPERGVRACLLCLRAG